MLDIIVPGEEICAKYGIPFVNLRLKELIEEHILDSASVFDSPSCEKIEQQDPATWEALRSDYAFARESIMGYGLVPAHYEEAKALFSFWALYGAITADEPRELTLGQEYVLYHLLEQKREYCQERMRNMPEKGNLMIKRIPEPQRSEMLNELEGIIKDQLSQYDDCSAEDLIAYYEDLEYCFESCFEDIDCLFLDEMTEEELVRSDLAKQLGIGGIRYDYKTEVDGVKINFKFEGHNEDKP